MTGGPGDRAKARFAPPLVVSPAQPDALNPSPDGVVGGGSKGKNP